MYQYTVSGNPTEGQFTTITEALQSLPMDSGEAATLLIMPGIYHEKLSISRDRLSLIGMGNSAADTIITYDDFAFDRMPDGSNRGTFRSYSVFVDGKDVTFQNLTIENASGDENLVGQAIALYADGDRFSCINCRLLGRQDTLFTGPLPPKELQPGGFIGPKQFAPRIPTRQYYQNCYLCGNVDFIFGSATAYFENCTLESLNHGQNHAVQGYVTAPSTPQGQPYGYVFHNCQFITRECGEETVYLGRPWRDFAQSVFLDCKVGKHIHPHLFHDWNKPAAREHACFATYRLTKAAENNSDTAVSTDSFARCLEESDVPAYTKQAVLGGSDHWNP